MTQGHIDQMHEEAYNWLDTYVTNHIARPP
jgi:hypothetical protein